MLNVVFSKEKFYIKTKSDEDYLSNYFRMIGYTPFIDYQRLLTPEIIKRYEHKERLNAMYAFDTEPIQV